MLAIFLVQLSAMSGKKTSVNKVGIFRQVFWGCSLHMLVKKCAFSFFMPKSWKKEEKARILIQNLAKKYIFGNCNRTLVNSFLGIKSPKTDILGKLKIQIFSKFASIFLFFLPYFNILAQKNEKTYFDQPLEWATPKRL